MINNIVVFDFETTGFSPSKDRVIEIAAVRIREGNVVGQFGTLVQFAGELPAKITEITGLTDADLIHGLEDVHAFDMLHRFIGDSLLVAHNALFDLGFLHNNMMRILGRDISNNFLDTMTISRERHVYPHKLTDMCNRYGIELEGAHRALNDVYGCWQLLKALHAEKPVDEYLNRLGYLNKFGAPKWAPEHAILFGTDNRYAG